MHTGIRVTLSGSRVIVIIS